MRTTITFYELSAYNDGRLVPHTFDLSDYADHEDFAAARAKRLEELTEQTGHLCEEWIVADYEGVPAQYVGEWDLREDFWTWREAFTESRLPLEVFEAGAALGISPEHISEAYVGTFDTPADFATAAGLVADGRLPLAPLVTHRIPLAEGIGAIERLAGGMEAQKILLAV